MHRMGAHIHNRETLPEVRRRIIHDYAARSKREQRVEPIEKGSRGKRRLDPPDGEKAAISPHWPCWLEREPVATLQEKYQEQTDQVQQG